MNLTRTSVRWHTAQTRHSHLANALVEVHVLLEALNLLDGELQYPPFALFGSNLLLVYAQRALRLNRGLLDLYQNLRGCQRRSTA